jgi:hypothetical protein
MYRYQHASIGEESVKACFDENRYFSQHIASLKRILGLKNDFYCYQ